MNGLQQQVLAFFEQRIGRASAQDFQHRPGQLEMAHAVAEAIEQRRHLIVEAGTGTGKTLAYLVPALLSGRRILISTATKTLQDQLMSKDLPKVAEMLGCEGVWMCLKGRENYVCMQRLEEAECQSGGVEPQTRHHLALIRTWLAHGGSGERGACEGVADPAEVWSLICARAEYCQHAQCSARTCRYPALREQAQQAQILVVNHHLLASDMALRMQGAPGILPERDIVIIDEAHQLPGILQQFLGDQLGSTRLRQLLDELVQACESEAPDELAPVRKLVEQIEQALSDLISILPEGRLPRQQVEGEIDPFVSRLQSVLGVLIDRLEQMKIRGAALLAARDELTDMAALLADWWGDGQDTQVCWFERGARWVRFYRTPLRVDGAFSTWMSRYGESWIFTSATLTDTRGFDFFQRRLGLDDVGTLQVDSPFDYTQQGLIYHPPGLPEPASPDYIRQCLRKAWPLLMASQGHALVLFSSYRALHEAHGILTQHWDGTLLLQGEAPREQLLARFSSSPKAILMATASFWEGVDLPGDQLRLVVIDKIPFSPPDDPVLQAQSQRFVEQGKSAFALLQLPAATLALKQGAGRLIRTEKDCGVLMLCDPRLTQKRYGSAIIRQLPPFRWTTDRREAVAFLESIAQSA